MWWFDHNHVVSLINIGLRKIRRSLMSLLMFHILLELILLLLAHKEMSLLLGGKVRLGVLRCSHISTDWASLVLPIVHVYRLGENLLLLMCRVVHWLWLRVIKLAIEGCRPIITRMHQFFITLQYPNCIILSLLWWNPSLLLLLMMLDQLILLFGARWILLLWLHAHVYASLLGLMLVLRVIGDNCERGLTVGFLRVGDPVVRR